MKAAAAAFSVSPATAHRWWHRWRRRARRSARRWRWLLDRSSRPQAQPAAARAELPGADLRVPAPHRLGPAARRRRDRPPHSTVWKVLQPPRALTPAAGRPRAGQPLRVAVPRRPAAHGRRRATRASSGPATPSPATARAGAAEAPATVGYDFAARDRRRPLAPRLRRAPSATSAPRPSPAFVERALAFFERHGVTAKRLMTDNAWVHARTASFRELLASRGRSGTCAPSPTGRARTARSSASTRRWRASGPTASPTAPSRTAPPPCHTGSATTTSADRTAHSETGHRSAAFTTSVGRTARTGRVTSDVHMAPDATSPGPTPGPAQGVRARLYSRRSSWPARSAAVVS